MILDKRKAIKKTWRTPESKLYLAALLGGFIGIWIGMLPPVNHKKSKSSFVFRTFLYTIANIMVGYFAYQRIGAYLFWDTSHLF